jgi:hypothetical protein
LFFKKRFFFLKKRMSERVDPIVFISGQLSTTESEFNSHYVPAIDATLARGVTQFVLGGAEGADRLAQLHLAKAPVSICVTVHDKGTQRNVWCDRFVHVNGYPSYPMRDSVLTEQSTEDLAFLHRDAALGSGTLENLLRRRLGQKLAAQVTAIVRKRDIRTDVDQACLALEEELPHPVDALNALREIMKHHAII